MSAFWITIAVVASTLLGVISNIIAATVQPRLERRKRLLFSSFISLLCLTTLATVLSSQNTKITQLPKNIITGELLFSEHQEWIITNLETHTYEKVQLPPWKDVYEPSWTPDGSKIIFSWGSEGADQRSLYTFDLVTGEIKSFLSLPNLDLGSPRWSPDGSILAFNAGADIHSPARNIYIFVTSTGQIRNLTENYYSAVSPSWSPDSSKLVVEASEKMDQSTMLLIIDVAGNSRVQIADLPEGAKRQPAWSPDGRNIAFVVATPQKEEIWSVDIFTHAVQQITITRESHASAYPSWSPDGNWLAYFSNQEIENPDREGNVYVISKDRNTIFRVTSSNTSWWSDLSWKP